jgi:hypothetical protein
VADISRVFSIGRTQNPGTSQPIRDNLGLSRWLNYIPLIPLAAEPLEHGPNYGKMYLIRSSSVQMAGV